MGFHQRLTQGGSTVSHRLADQILWGGNILFLQGKNHVQRRLNHRTDRFDLHILIGHSLDDIVFVVQTDFRFPGSDESQSVVVISRETDNDVQSFLGVVTALNCGIYETVQRIGIPVQDNVHLAKRLIIRTCGGFFYLFCRRLFVPCWFRYGFCGFCRYGSVAFWFRALTASG